MLSELNKIQKANCYLPSVGCMHEDMASYSYAWFKPKNELELKVLNDYFQLSPVGAISTEAIGEWVCIKFDGLDVGGFDSQAKHIATGLDIQGLVDIITAFGYTALVKDTEGKIVAATK